MAITGIANKGLQYARTQGEQYARTQFTNHAAARLPPSAANAANMLYDTTTTSKPSFKTATREDYTTFARTAACTAASTAASTAVSGATQTVGAWIDGVMTPVRLPVRGLQALLSLVAAGVYGYRAHENRADGDSTAMWKFAVAVAVLSAGAALVLTVVAALAFARWAKCLCGGRGGKKGRGRGRGMGAGASDGSTISSESKSEIKGKRVAGAHNFFPVDFILCVLWLVVFGLFADHFFGRSTDYEGASPGVQKTVAWLDLIVALLWLASGLWGLLYTCFQDTLQRVIGWFLGKCFGKRKPAVAVEGEVVMAKLDEEEGGGVELREPPQARTKRFKF